MDTDKIGHVMTNLGLILVLLGASIMVLGFQLWR